jgi:hypothetical protein
MSVEPKSLTLGGAAPTAPDGDGKRWSFLWLEPRGEICPECEFPLSKYFGRLKWIRTMMVGTAVVMLALVLQIIGVIGRFGGLIAVMKVTILVGAVLASIGVVGVVVGGRHGAQDTWRKGKV